MSPWPSAALARCCAGSGSGACRCGPAIRSRILRRRRRTKKPRRSGRSRHPRACARKTDRTLVAGRSPGWSAGHSDPRLGRARQPIDGMTFGDDPAEGAIRGRKFLHGRLGFAFLAPEGFVLENASQALLGIKAGGAEALRLDSVNVPWATPLAAYMATGWIDGLIDSSIETAEVNAMPAATATASAGEWKFRLAVIRFEEDRVYRLIFATRVLTDEAKQR